MKIYHLKFKINGQWIKRIRNSTDMETCLNQAKIDIQNEFGNQWSGGIAICGPQIDGYFYNF